VDNGDGNDDSGDSGCNPRPGLSKVVVEVDVAIADAVALAGMDGCFCACGVAMSAAATGGTNGKAM
jgi:hypothetical protein